MEIFKIKPEDAIDIVRVRKDKNNEITHLLVHHGVDGKDKEGKRIHSFNGKSIELTRDEFLEVCKDCKTIELAVRSYQHPENKKFKHPWDNIYAYLVEVNGKIYIRNDKELIPQDDVLHTELF